MEDEQFIRLSQKHGVDKILFATDSPWAVSYTHLDVYKRPFRLFAEMMTQEIGNHPEPDSIWDYLKSMDSKMLEIEGDTFDGLYMYYKGRYLYSLSLIHI